MSLEARRGRGQTAADPTVQSGLTWSVGNPAFSSPTEDAVLSAVWDKPHGRLPTRRMTERSLEELPTLNSNNPNVSHVYSINISGQMFLLRHRRSSRATAPQTLVVLIFSFNC